MNPARWFGPALIVGGFMVARLWQLIDAPILGGLAAGAQVWARVLEV